MLLFWQLPIGRQPLAIELLMTDLLDQVGDVIGAVFYGTCLQEWVEDYDGQTGATFFIILLATCGYLVWLKWWARRHRRKTEEMKREMQMVGRSEGLEWWKRVIEGVGHVEEVERAQPQAEHHPEDIKKAEEDVRPISESSTNDNHTPTRNLSSSPAPQSTVPTSSPPPSPSPSLHPSAWSHTDKFSTTATTGYQRKQAEPHSQPQRKPLPEGFTPFVPCTGRQSSPGYQTPFHDRTQHRSTISNDNTGIRRFPHLEHEAPVSWNTLRKGGMLDSEGTPTKKWRDSRLGRRDGEVGMSSDSVEQE